MAPTKWASKDAIEREVERYLRTNPKATRLEAEHSVLKARKARKKARTTPEK